MEITDIAALQLQANTLDAVRATVDAASAAAPTPQAQADAILELSVAAQQLLSAPRV